MAAQAGCAQGALANLGYEVCDKTVVNILRAACIPPSEEGMKKSTLTKRDNAEMAHLVGQRIEPFFTGKKKPANYRLQRAILYGVYSKRIY